MRWGIDSESASKRKEKRVEKREQQQITATGIEKQLNLKAVRVVTVVLRVSRVEDGGIRSIKGYHIIFP